ncbi:MAG: acetolactate synthase small subunit [Lachnospiraceae bacterium]|nr:acetolactate synthase small subunit [Lachnospiraceae bacterium]
MHTRVFQLLVDNTSGVLSRISGLFSRRGYNIESITAGVTADPRFTRITIVTSGDDDILEQIEKQLAKLIDVRSVKELKPENSVYRELCLIKVEVEPEKMQNVIALAGIYHATIEDLTENSLMIVITENQSKIDTFINVLTKSEYKILEIARTGIAGLQRGTDGVIWFD